MTPSHSFLRSGAAAVGLWFWPWCVGALGAPEDRLAEAIAVYEAETWPESSEDAEPGEGPLLPDVSPASDARRADTLGRLQTMLGAIDAERLSDQARLSYSVFRWMVEEKAEALAFDEARMPFDSDGGFDFEPLYRSTKVQPRTEAEAQRWIETLQAVPDFYAANIANARRGVRDGFTQPPPTVAAVLARAQEAAQTPPADDALLAPLRRLPADWPPARRDALLAAGERALRERVQPAREAWVLFLENEYAPRARASLAAADLPGGEAYYRFLVRRHTTTTLTPDEVHELGRREVARIQAEMQSLIEAAGFDGSLQAFIASLRSDPRFVADSRQDLLEKASEIAKRVDDRLPAWFQTLPRLSYGVREVPRAIEEGYTTGRYFPGSPKNGRAGGLMINTSHLEQRPLYELPALVLHEGAPGHHIQVALGQEQDGVPAFRRELYVTAFGEGWALYAERLGTEMGIYRDAYERFGRLSYEMWRACRLVADTGIHWKRWTLAQARACFADNTALSPHNIDVELQRYISWPGQALAYKSGELKIVELRRRAEAALGDDFDVRAFHDAVLLNGSLPLTVLEQQIERWIVAQREAG